jgi:glycerol-3-phosphate acyltransferase PlsY
MADASFGGANSALWLCLVAGVLAYLMGSLSFAVVVSRCMGLPDPRAYGSGNPGATNVLRSGSKVAAALTLFLDAFKGWLPVAAVCVWVPPSAALHEPLLALVGFSAFAGHLWPVFFRFKGGKGVATAAGVLLGFHPGLGLATLGVWLAVAVLARYSSLAALSAALSAPLWAWLWFGPGPVLLAVALMAALLVWRHESNIRKLLAGQESKLGQKGAKASAEGAPPPA